MSSNLWPTNLTISRSASSYVSESHNLIIAPEYGFHLSKRFDVMASFTFSFNPPQISCELRWDMILWLPKFSFSYFIKLLVNQLINLLLFLFPHPVPNFYSLSTIFSSSVLSKPTLVIVPFPLCSILMEPIVIENNFYPTHFCQCKQWKFLPIIGHQNIFTCWILHIMSCISSLRFLYIL